MRLFLIAAAMAALSCVPAVAQSYGGQAYYGGPAAYDPGGYRPRSRDYGGRDDFNGQADRPGDYRCDAYWDANRTDCSAGWRDQRPVRYSGYGYSRQTYGYRTDAGVYPGAYGRPDLIYPGGGYSPGHQTYGPRHEQGRDGRRIDWCRATYRSYDPASGYYRAYSGQLIFCG